ncbi:TPA: PDZ domain-containing protein [bacterium]|nr:PDZ domain-containing protein [bacterium]
MTTIASVRPLSNIKKPINIIVLFLLVIFSAYIFLRIWNNYASPNKRIGGPYFAEGSLRTVSQIDDANANITGSRNNAIVQAIKKAGDSVVSISTIQVVRDSFFDRGTWFDFFYPHGFERKFYGLGSGFIIDERGYVVTNNHVISDASDIKVTLSNGKQYQAKIVGSDKQSDLAVLKIDAPNLKIAELGNSNDLMVGEWVIAIGNPFGYLMKDSQPTVTVGVVSATGRTFQKEGVKLNNLIQTDAAINPGNSGGPLVNSFGQVIGINTAIYSTTGGYQGVGFAIPINSAKKTITKLIQFGMIKVPWLGMRFQDLNDDIAEHLGLQDKQGALVSSVLEDSPAYRSGIRNGDVIIAIDNEKISSANEADEIIRLLWEGEKARFKVLRGGETKDFFITIKYDELISVAEKLLGIGVQIPTKELAEKYGLSSIQNGVIVAKVIKGSPSDKAELKVGDLITKISREESDLFRRFSVVTEIGNIDDFIDFVSGLRKDQIIRVIFERKGELWQSYINLSQN